MVHKITRRKSASAVHHLQVDGNEITELADITNKIGQTFQVQKP